MDKGGERGRVKGGEGRGRNVLHDKSQDIIAECISARQIIRDLFSAYAYVRTCVLVTLRNVNICISPGGIIPGPDHGINSSRHAIIAMGSLVKQTLASAI